MYEEFNYSNPSLSVHFLFAVSITRGCFRDQIINTETFYRYYKITVVNLIRFIFVDNCCYIARYNHVTTYVLITDKQHKVHMCTVYNRQLFSYQLTFVKFWID